MTLHLVPLIIQQKKEGIAQAHHLPMHQGYGGGSHSLEIFGHFRATVQLEGTVDGEQWYTLASITDQPGLILVEGVFKALRGRITEYQSGQISMRICYSTAKENQTTTTFTIPAIQKSLLQDIHDLLLNFPKDSQENIEKIRTDLNRLTRMLKAKGFID
ncbi:hypothetical protein ACQZV8_10470 [Magnetococcales bacterium HHB-1]